MALTFYEFFAGAGMARAGLGADWECIFSNDFDRKKSATYAQNWGNAAQRPGDIRSVKSSELPNLADLAWASFPCQDLSLAGGGAGLKGERSGTFWPFWDLMVDLKKKGRAPQTITLENVCGTLTSHNGKDFAAICATLQNAGYKFGAMVVDAADFVPQSRPRLFIIAVNEGIEIPSNLIAETPAKHIRTPALLKAYNNLPKETQKNWVWWNPPAPQARTQNFIDIIEETPLSVDWHTPAQTRQLISMMSDVNLEKLRQAKRLNKKVVGTIYKRTRRNESGQKVQRAEIRFDNIAGCLRTPAGGSSRQLIMVVEGRKVRSRLISTREAARLMGLPDSYMLPESYNEAYHLIGDGVAVPVVRYIAKFILEPIILQKQKTKKAA